MSKPASTVIGDYNPLRDTLNASGANWCLTGGQAVNLYAELYEKKSAALSLFRPFTSKDVDAVVCPPHPPSVDSVANLGNPRGASAVYGILRDVRGEVLRYVPGAPEVFVEPTAIWQAPNGWPVVAPAVLLKAKLWNVANIPPAAGTKEPRQDDRHATMVAYALPAFLEEHAGTDVGDAQLAILAYLAQRRELDIPALTLLKLDQNLKSLASGWKQELPLRIYLSPLLPESAVRVLAQFPHVSFRFFDESQTMDATYRIDTSYSGAPEVRAIDSELERLLVPVLAEAGARLQLAEDEVSFEVLLAALLKETEPWQQAWVAQEKEKYGA